MKKLLLLLFVLLAGRVCAQNIGLKVVYQEARKIASLRSLALPQDVKARLIRKAKKQKDKFVLEMQDGKSYYHPITGNMFTQQFKIYDKKQSFTILDSDVNMEKPYAAKRDWADYNWVVDSQKVQVILGYKCYSAESKDGVLVWFAPKLKYPDGPVIYGGLAGMILKVENKYSIITAIEITKDVQVDSRMPQDFELISLAQLRQRRALNR